MLGTSAVQKFWGKGVGDSEGCRKKGCREVLENSVVEKCCRRVL